MHKRISNWPLILFISISCLLVCQGTAFANFKTPFSGGTYRAVVFGNDNYRDPEGIWTKLKTARNDAKAVADVLKITYGFTDVSLVLDATRRDIFQSFRLLEQKAKPNDAILIYYAGHGYFRKDSDEAFWIPIDAQGTDDSTFVSNETIRKKIEVLAKRTQHTLIISDSCFSGSLLRPGNRGIRLQERTPKYFEKVASRKSVQLLAAGGLEFVDDNYRNSGHSPFTYHFIKELERNTEQFLTATELSTKVEKLVADNVPQKPEKGVLYQAGHEGGEFIFTRKVAISAPPISQFDTKPGPGVSEDTMIELTYWNSIKDSNDASLFLNYLKRYPSGEFIDIAKHKIELLRSEDEIQLLSDLVRKARSAYDSGNYGIAHQLWSQLQTKQPHNRDAQKGLEQLVSTYLDLATKARKRRRFEEAKEWIDKAEELDLLKSDIRIARNKLKQAMKPSDKREVKDKLPPVSF